MFGAQKWRKHSPRPCHLPLTTLGRSVWQHPKFRLLRNPSHLGLKRSVFSSFSLSSFLCDLSLSNFPSRPLSLSAHIFPPSVLWHHMPLSLRTEEEIRSFFVWVTAERGGEEEGGEEGKQSFSGASEGCFDCKRGGGGGSSCLRLRNRGCLQTTMENWEDLATNVKQSHPLDHLLLLLLNWCFYRQWLQGPITRTAALKPDRVECLIQAHTDGNWESKQCFVCETLSCQTRVRSCGLPEQFNPRQWFRKRNFGV